jgi:hypothetical protein
MVLLGIRTALKDDLRCTAAELVYGTNLRWVLFTIAWHTQPLELCHTAQVCNASFTHSHRSTSDLVQHCQLAHTFLSDTMQHVPLCSSPTTGHSGFWSELTSTIINHACKTDVSHASITWQYVKTYATPQWKLVSLCDCEVHWVMDVSRLIWHLTPVCALCMPSLILCHTHNYSRPTIQLTTL